MKRFYYLLAVLAATLMPAVLATAQNADRAAQLAEKQELDEKYKSLSAAVQALQESQAALQKNLERIKTELNELSEKVGKQPANMATQEEIKRLAEKIVEVDQKRVADNKLIKEKFDEFGKALKAAPVAPPPPTRKTNETSGVNKNEKGYDYVIASGDTLSKIIKTYKENGVKVSQKAIEDANPNVNWNKLQIGQKIWVPAPKE